MGGLLIECPVVAAPQGVRLDVTLKGLRSTKGKVLICMTGNGKYFPDCGMDPNAHKATVPTLGIGVVSFTDVTPGTYLITVLHDENGNGRMDKRLFLPAEGFGLSRNPKIGLCKPKVPTMQFPVGSEDVKQSINMHYVF